MPKTKKKTRSVRAVNAELRKRIKAIGVERDALRELEGTIQSLAISCDDAIESLENAISALSQYA